MNMETAMSEIITAERSTTMKVTKGSFTYDVHTEGEEVAQMQIIGCVIVTVTREKGGSKIPKILRTSYMNGP